MRFVKKSKPSFNSILNELLNDDFFKPVATTTHRFRPPVNIKETDKAFEMEISVPGLSKKDVNIDIDGDLLTISYERAEKKTEEKKDGEVKVVATEKYTRKEFTAQSFKRSFTIPENTDAEKIAANMKNGILNVSLPKVEVPEPEKKTIVIK